MTDARTLAERYIAAWNEQDGAARRAAVADLWTEGAVYTDPLGVAEGRDAIAATIGAVQEQFAGMVFALVGDVDAHHDVVRFTWGLGPAGAEPLVVGFDVAVLAGDGRIDKVHGFLDKVPA
ncbi:nuclear transport factor 2 family protein [Actinomadura parmotrematis]|uniref:Nuclear transport factor 2 family protein n=1 Tax=Actinomadura parmotrematis TaxID=2864039 RepID=A0ABS7G5E4_9ACTN|nr:nuclear transport factor 2 family protein [Actinomadura parmotrematis]MBW8487017.1 nuclear transport factor 2 family protein [Actinomadura parmotrematis]